jgi:hypothetical protein
MKAGVFLIPYYAYLGSDGATSILLPFLQAGQALGD